jgi:hypothetical protein
MVRCTFCSTAPACRSTGQVNGWRRNTAKARRKWRKLHLAVDAASGRIVAQSLTDQDTDAPSQMAPLLDQIDGRIGRVTADGAYDGAPTYETIAAHGDGIAVIPPRSTAIPSGEVGSPTQRDRHLKMISERGRLTWQVATDYGATSADLKQEVWIKRYLAFYRSSALGPVVI